jgi:hypothetical protein
MTKVHRGLFQRLGDVRAVNLNTPYGFQENLTQMSEKLVAYFDTSLQVTMTDLNLASVAAASDDERRAFKQAVAAASFVFAGPGSPSYALNQWRPLELNQDLATTLANGGVVCFSSAAALTLGAFTPPVYEIYKAGTGLAWLPGLDLMTTLGLSCVVLPHYNNAEGGTYDTSRCYIGERRLQLLEAELPAGVSILGIDEHTAAIIDLDSRTLTVQGKGGVHWRSKGAVSDFAAGSTIALSELGANALAFDALTPVEVVASATRNEVDDETRQLRDEALVAALDEVRTQARAQGHYDIADAIRNALANFGVVIRDGAISKN